MIGDIGGVSTYMSQNVPTFTGTAVQGDSPTVTNAVATNQVLYDTVKNTEGTPGIWGPAAGGAGTGLVIGGVTSGVTIKAGTVFTLGSGATNVLASTRSRNRCCHSGRCSPSWPMWLQLAQRQH